MNRTTPRILLFGLILVLLVVSACKMDLEQEIWLKSNNSGKAKVTATFTLPQVFDLDQLAQNEQEMDNLLSGMQERASNVKGVKITKYDHEMNKTDDELVYKYVFDFTFKDLKGLSAVLYNDSNTEMSISKTKQGKLLSMDARLFDLQTEGDAESMEYLQYLDSKLKTTIHLPKKAKSIDASGYGEMKGKDVVWTIPLDEDWYYLSEQVLSVLF